MPKNRYFIRSRISETKFRAIIRWFAEDFPANKIAKFSGVSRKSVNRTLLKIRIRIFCECEKSPPISGSVEIDESYFGAKRVRGKRGRGAAGKTPVFGLLKRDGRVYTRIVKNCSRSELMPIIRGHVIEGSTIHTDGWGAYDGLILDGYKHHRVHHSQNEFVRGKSHVNGIESFWSFAKRRLAKFNGIPEKTFVLHLKECEFRFNLRKKNLRAKLLKIFREEPLK